MSSRYAIYAMPPPGSALWSFGSSLIGYDAVTGSTAQQVPPGFSADEWQAITAAPRVYGFHATLKAPFRLRSGATEADLLDAFADFCRRQPPVPLPGLAARLVGQAGAFVALTPAHQTEALHALERASVCTFEPFRAALSEAEMAKRQPNRLDERGRHYLQAYGYPHIFERFRLHFTLTGPIDERAGQVEATLQAMFQSICESVDEGISHLGLFRQSDGERFRVLQWAALGAI